jgi:hypothetical protein
MHIDHIKIQCNIIKIEIIIQKFCTIQLSLPKLSKIQYVEEEKKEDEEEEKKERKKEQANG